MDGRSIVPLLKGGGKKAFANREILVEGGKTRGDCLYAGVRTKDLVYLEHAEATSSGCNRDAETELYDLTGKLTGDADPGQLENLTSRVVPASNDADVRKAAERLSRRTKQLRGCDGKSCR